MFKENKREYHTWNGMVKRCYDKNRPNYKYYGARGITVCERWLEEGKGFKNFLEDMGKKPEGLTLERKNNNEGYSPLNCCWATWEEQRKNKRQRVSITNEKYVSIKRNRYNGKIYSFYYRIMSLKKGINRTFKTIEEAITFRDKLIADGILPNL